MRRSTTWPGRWPRTVGRAVRPRVVRNLLSGTYLGHPLHPVLTDLSIGGWVMCWSPPAWVAAVPTAAAGLNDWSDTPGPRPGSGCKPGPRPGSGCKPDPEGTPLSRAISSPVVHDADS